MPQEKARRQLQLETDMYKVFQRDPKADENSRWRNPRTGSLIPWTRKALDIFHLYRKISDECGTLHSAEKLQREPESRHDGSQPE